MLADMELHFLRRVFWSTSLLTLYIFDWFRELSEFEADMRKPNTVFLNEQPVPLLERDRLRFWQGLALIMLFINLALLVILLRD